MADHAAATDQAPRLLRQPWRWLKAQLAPYAMDYDDPGRREAWWWLVLPVAFAIALAITFQVDRDFYVHVINWEGTGLLEFGHTLVPLISVGFGVAILKRRWVRKNTFLLFWIGVATLGSFYIAGEEASWGQHYAGWATGEFFARINDQGETNLHNISGGWFDQKPRMVLEMGVVVGGIILPVWALFRPAIRRNDVALIIPPLACLPVAVIAELFGAFEDLRDLIPSLIVVERHLEVQETYFSFFVLFYLIVFLRRVRQIEARGMAAP